MSTVQLVKPWSTGGITPNLRRAYTSLNDQAGWWIFQNTQRLSAKWTRKWESDGAAGPSGAGDTTQRLTSVAACSVRGTAANTPQSYGVYTATDGCQILIAYQGAGVSPTGDDIIRIAFSKGGLYTLAGTTTQQPTATDEVVVLAATSVVSASTSLDRVMTIWCVDGDWRMANFRSSAIINVIGIGKINPLVSTRVTNPIFTPPYVGYRFNALKMPLSGDTYGQGPASANVPSIAVGSAGFLGVAARIYTDASRITRAGGGVIVTMPNANNWFNSSQGPTFTVDKPPLQNGEGSPLLPIYWSGERASQLEGFLGSTIDWWCAYSSSQNVPALTDPFNGWDPADTPGVTTPRSNWLMSLGSACVWPWCNVAANMEIV